MTTTMTLRLDDETSQRLSKMSGATERSKSYLTMQALKQFLDNNEWQIQEIKRTIAEADHAGSDQYIENDVVMSWMESWGTGQEKPSPRG